MKILVVDDHRDSVDSLSRLLEAHGHTTARAYDGRQALEACRRFEPDVVVLDIDMQSTASFSALKDLPGARPVADDRLSVTGELHGIEPYASSPLLHGHALQLSPTRVFVLLWTS